MKSSLIFSFTLIGKVGITTAIPLVSFALIGRYFDTKFNTGHYLLLTGIALATVVVYFAIRKLVEDSMEEFNKLSEKK